MKTKELELKNFLFPRDYKLNICLGTKDELKVKLKELHVSYKKSRVGLCMVSGGDTINVFLYADRNPKIGLLSIYVHELTHAVDLIIDRLGIEENSALILKPRLLSYLVKETKDIISGDWTERQDYKKSSDLLKIYGVQKINLEFRGDKILLENLPEKRQDLVVIPNNDEEKKLENTIEGLYSLVLTELDYRGVDDTETRAYATGYLVSEIIEK